METFDSASSILHDCLVECRWLGLESHRLHECGTNWLDQDVIEPLTKIYQTVLAVNEELTEVVTEEININWDVEDIENAGRDIQIPEGKGGQIIYEIYSELVRCHAVVNKLNDVMEYQPANEVVTALAGVCDELGDLKAQLRMIARNNVSDVDDVEYDEVG